MRTIFIKVDVKERLPEKKEAKYITNTGSRIFYCWNVPDNLYCWSGVTDEIKWWLEEIELPSEEEIDIMAKIHGKSNVINVPNLDWKIGANYILSKIFKTK